jgi:thiol-disulfide isomerase/thioredoxin
MTRRFTLVFYLILFAFLPVASLRAAEAPAFTLPDGHGAPVSSADLRGKVVLVDFWASWCVPCLKSFPWLTAMQAKYGARGLVVVGINLDKSQADAQRFLGRVPHDFTLLYDPEGSTARSFAVKAMPSSFLLDRRGGLVLEHGGFRDADQTVLESAIAAALENR